VAAIDDKAPPAIGVPGRIPAGPLAAALLFVVLVHVAWWNLDHNVVQYGNLADSDGYAHLLRVERLIATGNWLDASLPRANAPFGGSLHWTRPFDVLLIALALPMAPLLGFAKALYWSGALIGPLLHLATAAAMAWAAAPLVGTSAALIAAALTATQFGVLGYATVGHADHHVLLALIAVVAFGFTVRALAATGGGGVRHALAAGVVFAVGNWVGTEAQIPAALAIAVLGLTWVAGNDRAGERNMALALGLFGGIAAATLIERGPARYFAVEYDRLSVVHLTQAAVVATFWAAVASLARRGREPAGPMTRLLAAGGAAALGLALMRALYPKILINPLKDFDPEILRIFGGVSEYAPITDLPHLLLYLGAAVFALPWAAKRLRQEWAGGDRWGWLLLIAACVVYVVLALGWIRWSLYAGLFLLVALADLMLAADASIDRRFAPPWRAPVKVLAMIALAVGPLALGAAGGFVGDKAAAGPPPPMPLAEDPRACPLQPMARFLESPPWSARPRIILASANFGAELLYRTRHRVLAIIHHRIATGILDGVRILGGGKDNEIHALVREREVDLILLCRFGSDDTYFWKGKGDGIFYRRLQRGELPSWLREATLPAALKGRFRLFEVLPPG